MFEHAGLCLRKLSREDLPLLLALKEESWFGTHRVSILNPEDQERWYNALGTHDFVFIASDCTDRIGIFKALHIDWHSRAASVGWDIFREYRGRGYGKRIVEAGTALCFEILNLRRLDAEVLENNVRSRRCAEAAGYILEGCRRGAVQRQRQTLDSYVYGLLAENYFGRWPRVNYVMAAWSGPRRFPPPVPTLYLEKQFESLQRTPHRLVQVTVVAPHNPDEPPEFTRFLGQLPPKLGGARVQLLRTPNSGISYGSYSYAYGVYGRAFDYYIFVEDDYVFTQPDFDSILIDMFREEQQCGYVAGLLLGTGDQLYGAISHGLTSSKVLEEIWEQHSEIPHARYAGQHDNAHQIEFTRAFMINGRRLSDVTRRYTVRYNDQGKTRTYGDGGFPVLMQPISHMGPPHQLTILILLLYHERPVMVRGALLSVLRAEAHYPRWELAFIDDRSTCLGEPIGREILSRQLSKVRFYRNPPTDAKKESMVGQTMNQAILESDADIAIILCDDDELHPEYLANLNDFFSEHPEEMSCYSLVHLYNPAWEDTRYVDNLTGPLNRWRERIQPANCVDASQVAWRTCVNKELGAWFDYPRTACLDTDFYHRLSAAAGDTPFSGFVAQYKGMHPAQLVHHLSQPTGLPIDAPDVRRMTSLGEVLTFMQRYAQQNKYDAVQHIVDIALNVYPTQERFLRKKATKYKPSR